MEEDIEYWTCARQVERLNAENAQLRAALLSLRHADGCFCDGAFVMPGDAHRHSPECEAAQAALAGEPGRWTGERDP